MQLELNSSYQSPRLGGSSKSPINLLHYQFLSSHPCSWHVSITRTHKKMIFDANFKELDPKCTSQSIQSPISLPGVQKVPPLEERSCVVAVLPWMSTVLSKSCYQENKKQTKYPSL